VYPRFQVVETGGRFGLIPTGVFLAFAFTFVWRICEEELIKSSLSASLSQPRDDLIAVLVRRKHGIEHFLNPLAMQYERAAFGKSPSIDLEGRQAHSAAQSEMFIRE
jgi:hypothetical protein